MTANCFCAKFSQRSGVKPQCFFSDLEIIFVILIVLVAV